MSKTTIAQPIAFDQISNWDKDDLLAAYEAFRISDQSPITRPLDQQNISLFHSLTKLREKAKDTNLKHHSEARNFFEMHFNAFQMSRGLESGMITGYFEPVVKASKIRNLAHSRPLYALPEGHIRLEPNSPDFPPSIPSDFNAANQHLKKQVSAYPSREDINAFDSNPPSWLKPIAFLDPVDAYFIHIQGSATLELENGDMLRIAYAGRNGHPYISIGKAIINEGIMKQGEVTYDSLVKWLKDNPNFRDKILNQNPSYIFFAPSDFQNFTKGPVAAAGVALTSMRSMAIDRDYYPYHLPIFVHSEIFDSAENLVKFEQLMIAQDTGAAIKGMQRGDVFFGRGEKQGILAGKTQNKARFTLLLPKDISPESLNFTAK